MERKFMNGFTGFGCMAFRFVPNALQRLWMPFFQKAFMRFGGAFMDDLPVSSR